MVVASLLMPLGIKRDRGTTPRLTPVTMTASEIKQVRLNSGLRGEVQNAENHRCFESGIGFASVFE